jgi:plastocyanin
VRSGVVQCRPRTGACVSPHAGVQFDDFIRELTQTQKVGAWNFAPRRLHVRDGQAFQAENRGGEVHTFTEVDEFGGGIVEMLNELSGNPVPAPECLALGDNDFIPPGGRSTPEMEEPGVHHYQCCIHPWLRTDVTVR